MQLCSLISKESFRFTTGCWLSHNAAYLQSHLQTSCLCSLCFDPVVTICTQSELISRGCFDLMFIQGEFRHVARVARHRAGGRHESSWCDRAEFTDGGATPAKQNSLRGRVNHWRCASYGADWSTARPLGEYLWTRCNGLLKSELCGL